MTRIPQTKRQLELAIERNRLQIILDDGPTDKERKAAIERVARIDAESKVHGYLSAKGLMPPE